MRCKWATLLKGLLRDTDFTGMLKDFVRKECPKLIIGDKGGRPYLQSNTTTYET